MRNSVTYPILRQQWPMSLRLYDGGCGVVGIPHPSHPIIKPRLTTYEIARAARREKKKKTSNESLVDEKSMVARWGELRWELRESFGNLQSPTHMLSYNRLDFISFRGWSSEGAWSWWLVPLVLPFRRKNNVGVWPPSPSWRHLLRMSF